MLIYLCVSICVLGENEMVTSCAICKRKLDGRTGFLTMGGADFCLRHIEKEILKELDVSHPMVAS